MKYVEASAHVIDLENSDVLCSVISGDDTAKAVNAFLDKYGNNLNENQRNAMFNEFANGIDGFARMINEYGEGKTEAEWAEILKNANKFGTWVDNTCSSTAHSYSNDSEDEEFDSEW